MAGQSTEIQENEVLRQDEIEALLNGTEQLTSSRGGEIAAAVPSISQLAPLRFDELKPASAVRASASPRWSDQRELQVRIELGRTRMYSQEVRHLRRGTVVALDPREEDPVDVYADGRLVARGEVVALNGNFCVRVNEVVATQATRSSDSAVLLSN